ncbi:MAG: FtsX-like permease family protein [Clostridia bacterium]|nr:FtsX-like permease family protein [Clostridia bacterium]
MKKSFFKLMLRSITGSIGRFLGIFGIAALGVGFLAGLTATTPDMRQTVDAMYDAVDQYDVRILSAGGFSRADADAVAAVEGVRSCMPAYVADVLTDTASFGAGLAARIHSLPEGDAPLNGLTLVEGRMPAAANECVAEYHPLVDGTLRLGDTLSLPQEGTEAFRTFSVTEYTIVGRVESASYFSIESQTTSVGDGSLAVFFYVPSSAFAIPGYTCLYLTVDGAAPLNCFENAYFDKIDPVCAALQTLGERRAPLRRQEILRLVRSLYPAARELTDEQLAQLGPLRSFLQTEWHVLDRRSDAPYVSFADNADKVEAIARVFPVFFFLVAALVALTTMTRMVEEERTRIGTLRALGYRTGAVLAQYLSYAGAATVSGSAVGCLIGFRVLPAVIWNAYAMMYRLPPIQLPFRWKYALIASGAAAASILLATLFACVGTLREPAARLMQPRAPKPGKRILLERITPFWSRLSFTFKVTLRNLFRYKKRFFMTVFGVAGCTALLLTGFGLKDSISGIVGKQFGEICRYDVAVALKSAQDPALNAYLQSDAFSRAALVMQTGGALHHGTKTRRVSIIAAESAASLCDVFLFRDRLSGKEIAFTDDSVLLTEKLAEKLSARVGDRLDLENGSGLHAGLTVTGIVENYVYDYVYMTADTYVALFDEPVTWNRFMACCTGGRAAQQQVGAALLRTGNVSAVTFTAAMQDSFADVVKNMNYIVAVLILSAGLLALVVLYNLININLTERRKEIATLSVLGFSGRETGTYIFREIALLSVLGTMAGLFFGIFLHAYVVRTAEVDVVMFARTIEPLSYLFSALITFLFTALVCLMMYPKIKRVDMVESMKAGE